MSSTSVNNNNGLKGVKDPEWTCPNCGVEKFKSQRELIAHALPCKQGRD